MLALASLVPGPYLHFDNDSPVRPIRCIGFQLRVTSGWLRHGGRPAVFVERQEEVWWKVRHSRQGEGTDREKEMERKKEEKQQRSISVNNHFGIVCFQNCWLVVRSCVRACVRACVRVCVRACVRVCVLRHVPCERERERERER